MPWRELSILCTREEFVRLAAQPGANKSELCRRFEISRPTGDKWIARFAAEGRRGLLDKSRRPHCSPERTPHSLEEAIVDARKAHPIWGARTLRAWMRAQRGVDALPAAVTFQAIFARNGLIDPAQSLKHSPFVRFERTRPNALWQIDFKGHFPLMNGARCHPLTVLDDHSRYNVCLRACGNEQSHTVQAALTNSFRHYGLPDWMIMDNGPPWGDQLDSPYTPLTVWLMSLGIGVSHSRPYHPQTLGKDERFHRTLKAELLSRESFKNLARAQQRFNQWRDIYNLQRPHQALELKPPITRYRPSMRTFTDKPPAFQYAPTDIVRRVQAHGQISYRGCVYRLSKAFRGQAIALRMGAEDGALDVFFRDHHIGRCDLRANDFTHL